MMFSLAGIIFSLLVYCKGQLRPPNWDMDVMRFDQNDWNRYDRDFGQNDRRPFPSFRPRKIPTQQPPIVGQIPGQIGGQGGQKGQSGNDNVPPPLPPMPRQPGPPKIPPQPPTFDVNLGGGLNPTAKPSNGDKTTPGRETPTLPSFIPSLGPEDAPEPSEPPPGPQDQVPPPMEPDPMAGEEETAPNATEVPNQSETPPPMSGEGEATSTQASLGGEQDNGFSFGLDMDGDGFGQEASTVSQEKFGFSGEDAFPTLQPSDGDQGGGLTPTVGGDLTVAPPKGNPGVSSAASMGHKVQGDLHPGFNRGTPQMEGSAPGVSPVKLQRDMGGLGTARPISRPVERVRRSSVLGKSSRYTKG